MHVDVRYDLEDFAAATLADPAAAFDDWVTSTLSLLPLSFPSTTTPLQRAPTSSLRRPVDRRRGRRLPQLSVSRHPCDFVGAEEVTPNVTSCTDRSTRVPRDKQAVRRAASAGAVPEPTRRGLPEVTIRASPTTTNVTHVLTGHATARSGSGRAQQIVDMKSATFFRPGAVLLAHVARGVP